MNDIVPEIFNVTTNFNRLARMNIVNVTPQNSVVFEKEVDIVVLATLDLTLEYFTYCL